MNFMGIYICCIRNFHTNFNLLFNDAAVNLSFSFRTPSISCLELTVNQGLMCVSKRKKGKDRSVTYLISSTLILADKRKESRDQPRSIIHAIPRKWRENPKGNKEIWESRKGQWVGSQDNSIFCMSQDGYRVTFPGITV